MILKSPWPDGGRGPVGAVKSSASVRSNLQMMYRGYPDCAIRDVFRFSVYDLEKSMAGWREGTCWGGEIKRVCAPESPVFLSDFCDHRVLKTAPFVRAKMQGSGGLLVSQYWPYLYSMICERNPKVVRLLSAYSPERILA